MHRPWSRATYLVLGAVCGLVLGWAASARWTAWDRDASRKRYDDAIELNASTTAVLTRCNKQLENDIAILDWCRVTVEGTMRMMEARCGAR